MCERPAAADVQRAGERKTRRASEENKTRGPSLFRIRYYTYTFLLPTNGEANLYMYLRGTNILSKKRGFCSTFWPILRAQLAAALTYSTHTLVVFTFQCICARSFTPIILLQRPISYICISNNTACASRKERDRIGEVACVFVYLLIWPSPYSRLPRIQLRNIWLCLTCVCMYKTLTHTFKLWIFHLACSWRRSLIYISYFYYAPFFFLLFFAHPNDGRVYPMCVKIFKIAKRIFPFRNFFRVIKSVGLL